VFSDVLHAINETSVYVFSLYGPSRDRNVLNLGFCCFSALASSPGMSLQFKYFSICDLSGILGHAAYRKLSQIFGVVNSWFSNSG
jgi:hypothetical protein